MKKIKLFKTLLIPSLGVLTLKTITIVSTSCSCAIVRVTAVVTANADSTLELTNRNNNSNLQYSVDGKFWIDYSALIDIHQGQTLYLKGNNPNGWSTGANTYSSFKITGNVSLSGNIMALIDNGKGTATAAIPNEYCFYSLFRNSTGITSVSKDFLPATSLAEGCYDSMFYGCTNLRNAPELPATELANYCYWSMFNGCTSLAQAPELPATSLVESCYESMFDNCSSLTTAPELPATTLVEHCYFEMFHGCSSLNSIRIGYTGTVAEAPSGAFFSWVEGVANAGTFYYKGNDTLANFGFPEGWTVNPN